jgi:hypothetical protein
MNNEPQERFLCTKAILLFLFSKRLFVEFAVQFGASKSTKGAFNEDYSKELITTQTNALKESFFDAGFRVVGYGVISGLTGLLTFLQFGPCPSWLSALLQSVGVAIILWATLWQLGLYLRTIDPPGTLAEQVHQWLFNLLYLIGSNLFFFAYAWSVQW